MKNSIRSLIRIFIFGLLCLTVTACGNSKCLDSMESDLQAIDAQQGNIRPGNESVILKGDASRVVFLLHGFLGSPFEVRPLGEALHAKGYTVVMPLLRGFGRTTIDSANTSVEDWLSSTQAQMTAATQCGGKIQVAGFSLGALVETKLLLDSLDLRDQVASFTMLSPALIVQDQSMMNAGATILKTVNKAPDVTTMAGMARKMGNYDLDIPETYPDYYSQEISLYSVKELSRLTTLIDYPSFGSLHIPLKIIYSEMDHTVYGASAVTAIAPYDPEVTAYVITADKLVPHQILFSDAPGLTDTISDEVKNNFRF